MKLELTKVRDTIHSILYKHPDGTNAYVRKEHLGDKPPQKLVLTDEVEN